MTTILAIDFDRWACETYRANFPGTRVECGDIRAILPQWDAAKWRGAADIIVGGPPCQPFSNAGERKGKEDERDCIPDFVQAVDIVRPRQFVMENVPGIASIDGGKYWQDVTARLSALGYVVQVQMLDAVDFGVPQFRKRYFWWGIRKDVWDAGARHKWPKPTHAWPHPEPSMFGGELLPAVTVGQALGLEAWATETNTSGGMAKVWRSPDEPSCSPVAGGNALGGLIGKYRWSGAIRRARGASVDRRDHPATEPCPTIRDGSNGSNGSGGVLRVVGAGRNVARAADGTFERDERDITNEPCTTLTSKFMGTHKGAQNPRVHEYRWSDAMLVKHPPASPASPAPTVQAKWFKGGAEGLVRIDGASGWSGQRILNEEQPSTTVGGGTNTELVHDVLEVDTKQARTNRPASEPAAALAHDSRHELKDRVSVRRLSPEECARLQSMPDDFKWPPGISKTQKYKIIGNGWACGVAKALGRALEQADPQSQTMIDLFCGGGLAAAGLHGNAWEYKQ